jgi:hypothetical protein
MISKHIVKELETIVNKGLEDGLIPYQKGNSIRIKNMVIRYNERKGYLIYNTSNNSQVARTYFKSSALAIAKSLAEGKPLSIVSEVIRKSKNQDAVEVREIRLDIAIHKSRAIRDKIDKYIFGI